VFAALQIWVLAGLLGGVMFVIGLMKYHAGLTRRRS